MNCVICGSDGIRWLHKRNDSVLWDEKKCPHCYSRFCFGLIVEWDLSRISALLEALGRSPQGSLKIQGGDAD